MKKLLFSVLLLLFTLSLYVGVSAATLESFELNIQAVRMIAGETLELTALPSLADAEYTVTYTTGSDAVAKVDNNGKITAVAAGDTYITATTNTGLSSTCHVFVYDEELPAVKFVASDYDAADDIIVASLGDSITTYVPAPDPGMPYHKWWANWYQVDNRNFGISGSTVGTKNNGGSNPMVNRYQNMPDNADLVTVKGGTNDFFSTSLGTLNDRVTTTYRGALKILMEGLIEKYPSAQIVFFSPIKRCEIGQTVATTNGYGNTLNDYASAVVELAEIYGLKAVNLYVKEEVDFTSPIVTPQGTGADGKWHDAVCESDLMPDGLHPSGKGQKIMAEVMAEALDEIGVIDIKDPVIIGSGNCGDSLTWALTHRNVLTISGSGDMADYAAESVSPWSKFASDISTISIGSKVTSIGNGAFSGCTAVKNVYIPTLVTSIGADAFNGCTNLSTVTVPESVTAIGEGAFANCSDTLNIRSFAGSAAQTYASENSIAFTAISGDILGDVDIDCKVDSIDVIKLARHLADWTGYENINTINADVNGDGEITVSDSTILARHWAGWIKYQTLPYVG